MIDIATLVSDPYNRKARLQPALLVMLPALVMAFPLVPALESRWAAIVGLIVYCGGAMLLTQLGRDRGKTLEQALFNHWGGKPSVALLRHSDSRLPKQTKNRYRDFLQRNVPGLCLPTAEQETQSPAAADEAYEAAGWWLRAQTRDHKAFALLFEENMNYGCRRNLWAMKPAALAFDLVVLVAVVAVILIKRKATMLATFSTVHLAIWLGLAVATAHLLAFILIVRRSWVRLPADAFAEQLLAACDVLSEGRSGNTESG